MPSLFRGDLIIARQHLATARSHLRLNGRRLNDQNGCTSCSRFRLQHFIECKQIVCVEILGCLVQAESLNNKYLTIIQLYENKAKLK